MKEYSDVLTKLLVYANKNFNGQPYFVAAAALDKKGRIIAIGQNSYVKSHPLMRRYGLNKDQIFLHAEVSALVKTRRKAHTLVVARVNKKGNFAMAKPCKVCQLAINSAKLEHVYYTNKEGNLIELE